MTKKNLDKTIQSYIVSPEQMAIDYKMVPYDIWGTMAHAIMLYKTKILDKKKAKKVLLALFEIEKDFKRGKYKIDPQKGAHLTLESKIVDIAGNEAGLSVHTARSRNDQVATCEMLYLKNETLKMVDFVLKVARSLLNLTQKHKSTVMPGYTHMQPAKPTTFAHWCLSFFDSFIREIQALQDVYQKYDLNPLGSVESHGTSWSIDRELTTKLLGFTNVWEIPQDAISSRGFFQLNILSSLNKISLTAGKLACDLLLFSTNEFGMIELPQDVAKRAHQITGSSVMPQKKNPDVLELIRSTAPQISACYQAVSGLLAGLPSGYNRDAREIKKYIHLGFKKSSDSLRALDKLLANLIVNKKRMIELVNNNYSLTTDLADYLSQKDIVPYRLVHKIIGKMVSDFIKEGKLLILATTKDINFYAKQFDVVFTVSNNDLMQVLDPKGAIEKRLHTGGTNPEKTKFLIKKRAREIKKVKKWIANKQNIADIAKKNTWKKALEITNQK